MAGCCCTIGGGSLFRRQGVEQEWWFLLAPEFGTALRLQNEEFFVSYNSVRKNVCSDGFAVALNLPSFIWIVMIPPFNPNSWTDISIPITDGPAVRAFFLPPTVMTPFRAGSFVGSVEEGGACRCDVVTFAPHGNGTHTECVGHVAGRDYLLGDCLVDMLVLAEVVSILPTILPNADAVVTREALQRQLPQRRADALILRTQMAADPPSSHDYSGTNPVFVHPDAMDYIHELDVRHVLIDQPSVDREEDGGALRSHKIFWQWPHNVQKHRTITELVRVPRSIHDGLYVLAFNAANFSADAAPSRPVLFDLL
jgi:kynurenine formamidase